MNNCSVSRKRTAAEAALASLQHLPDELDEKEAKRLIDAAEELDDGIKEGLSAANLKRSVAQLGRRIKKNQSLRIQFPDDPERFLKSEVDLDEEIKKYKQLAVSPELLDEFVSSGGLPILISQLNHPNTDIAVEVVEVLVDITDPSCISESIQAEAIVDQLLRLTPSVLADTLLRIKEDDSEEDFQAVTNVLQVVENLTDLKPEASDTFGRVPKLLTWLIQKIRHGALAKGKARPDSRSDPTKVDYNRAYASEILGIILQNSSSSREFLGKRPDAGRRDALDGIDRLLRSVSVYRKKDPANSHEAEFVCNLFSCLCSLTLVPANQTTFGKAQGLELMIRMMKERKFSYRLALKLTSFALQNHPENCRTFVEKWGLKPLYGILMRKGVKTKRNSTEEREDDEHLTSMISSLCVNCVDLTLARVVNKFVENRGEKLERILEMHERYSTVLEKAERDRQAAGSIDELAEFELDRSEEDYLTRCENGLCVVQHIGLTITRLASMGNTMVTSLIWSLLRFKGTNIRVMQSALKEYADHLDAEKGRRERGRVLTDLREFAGQEESLVIENNAP